MENKEPIIKTHKLLAEHIKGKKILLMLSLGKDSVLCLQWLCSYAEPEKVTAYFYEFMAGHPGDEIYLKYLREKFPQVEIVIRQNPIEISYIRGGIYQNPIRVLKEFNKWEDKKFEFEKCIQEEAKIGGFDFICSGDSKYEDFSRRTFFHQKGLVFKNKIYPLGMFFKKEVRQLLNESGLKLHPCYKFTTSTYDSPSYWKMRNGIVASKKYWEKLIAVYPLLELDKFRFEKMFKKGDKK